MSQDIANNSSDTNKIILNSSLFFSVLKEEYWFKRVGQARSFTKRSIGEIDPIDLSILKRSRNTENIIKASDSSSYNKKSAHKGLSNQLKLYNDFQWNRTSEYFWPTRSGDYSPLSPDGEPLERQNKIGLDFWRWNREVTPLGYVPPLCTCKRTDGCVSALKFYGKGLNYATEYRVCENDVCRGLLYTPYSLLEIPLNRIISNGSEFATNVRVPDSTDVYCGNMKHTLIICTKNKQHEEECLLAIGESDVTSPIIYDVMKGSFLPYFKRYMPDSGLNTPTMAVEPIDSDVSDSDEYGIGQLFAIKQHEDHISIFKYDSATKKVVPLDNNLRSRWKNTVPTDASHSLEENANSPDYSNLSEENYQIYELMESFSFERRPLSFSMRSEDTPGISQYMSGNQYKIGNFNGVQLDYDIEFPINNFKVDKKTLETLCISDTLDNFYS